MLATVSNLFRIRKSRRSHVILTSIPVVETGNANAHMDWSEEGYRKSTVECDGLVLAVWPQKILFCELSRIPGGAASLRTLLKLWDDGELKLRKARAEERQRDPRGVPPGKPVPARPSSHSSPSEAYTRRMLPVTGISDFD